MTDILDMAKTTPWVGVSELGDVTMIEAIPLEANHDLPMVVAIVFSNGTRIALPVNGPISILTSKGSYLWPISNYSR